MDRINRERARGIKFFSALFLIVALAGSGVLLPLGQSLAQVAPVPMTINISPTNPSVFLGGILDFSAVVLDQFGAPIDVVVDWTSSDPAVGTISSPFPVFSALSLGSTTITASTAGLTASVVVTVVPDPMNSTPTTIEILPLSPSVALGGTISFASNIWDQYGSQMFEVVSWSSSDQTVGIIDPLFGYFQAVGEGVTTVSAASGTVTQTVLVTVLPAPVPTTLSIAPANVTLLVSETQDFIPTILDQYGNPMSDVVSWTSSNPAVGTIDPIFGYFLAVSAGTTTITATSGVAVGTATVTVAPSVIINASAGAGGTIAPSGTWPVVFGFSPTLTITPDPGFHIVSVVANGVDYGPRASFYWTYLTTNLTVVANFAPDTATNEITATAGANGTITPSGITAVNFGANQLYTITPDPGFAIATVVIDGASVVVTPNYQFTNVVTAHTISVTFVADSYTITSSAGVGGTITPLGATVVPLGGSQFYAIAANAGYRVADVSVDGVSQGVLFGYTIGNVWANHTINATFASTAVCQTAADTSGDGKVSMAEVLVYINQWKTGSVSMALVLQAINFWKAGTGC